MRCCEVSVLRGSSGNSQVKWRGAGALARALSAAQRRMLACVVSARSLDRPELRCGQVYCRLESTVRSTGAQRMRTAWWAEAISVTDPGWLGSQDVSLASTRCPCVEDMQQTS